MAPKKEIVILRSSDNVKFEVPLEVVQLSTFIKDMVQDVGKDLHSNTTADMTFPDINSNILAKVIEYCERHVNMSHVDDLHAWDNSFLNVDEDTVCDLLKAANFLNIKGLVDLSCQKVASMMKRTTPEQIRNIFNLKEHYTPEEIAEFRKAYDWAFR